jgi:hypothetical protein
MKRVIILLMICTAGVMAPADRALSEEAAWYYAFEGWIIRVFTTPAGGNHEVILEVLDASNSIVPANQIMGLAQNPHQIVSNAISADISLAFDEMTATAYVLYTDAASVLTLQPVPELTSIGSGEPNMSVTPNPVNFGTVTVGGSHNSTVTVTNSGTANMTITTIGSPSAPYSIAAGGTCTHGTTLTPGGNCIISVSFAPIVGGAVNRNFTVSSDGGNATVSLTGTGQTGGHGR